MLISLLLELRSQAKLVGTDEFCVERPFLYINCYLSLLMSPPTAMLVAEEDVLVNSSMTFSSAFNIAMGGSQLEISSIIVLSLIVDLNPLLEPKRAHKSFSTFFSNRAPL